MTAHRSQRKPAFIALLGTRNGLIGLVMTLVFLTSALFSPLLAPHDPYDINLDIREHAPSHHYPFGTDSLGRDIFSRVLYGARISLKVGVLAMSLSLVVGITLGAVAGYAEGYVDAVLMRFTDMFLALPAALFALAVMAIFEHPSINKIFIVLGLIGWTTIARLVRSRVLEIKNEDYVTAARALGFSHMRTLVRHVLPNAAAPIIVAATLGIAGNILTEAWLSFLGLGAEPHIPSWGRMITEGQSYLATASKPWIYVFPGVALFVTVMGFNLLGDGLRDVLDPTLKK